MKNYKFTINGNDYQVNIKNFEDNIAEIEVNGTEYEVQLHQEVKKAKTPKLVRAKTPTTSKPKPLATGGALKQIKAPLPGTIIALMVKEGDTVKKEDTLLTMEAMKMENKVLSEAGGVVKSIKVATGESVLQGQVLVEIE